MPRSTRGAGATVASAEAGPRAAWALQKCPLASTQGAGLFDTRFGSAMLPGMFGTLVKQKRKEKGMSQEDLAMRTGVTKQAISHLERGLGQCHLGTAQRLARELGIETIPV